MNHKPWFRVWQDHLFSDPRFINITLEAKGLLLVCWGLTNREDGKKCRLNVASLSRFCNHFCNDVRDDVRSLLPTEVQDSCFKAVIKELVDNGWIEFIDNGNSFISIGWDKWQEKAYKSYMRNQQRKRVADLSPNCRSNVAPKRREGEGEVLSSSSSLSTKTQKTPSLEKIRMGNFEYFWNVYPRKVGRGAAERAWKKVDQSLLPRILEAVEKKKKCEQWQEIKFIPHPSTWLNDRRWEDQLEPSKNGVDMDEVNRINAELRAQGVIR